MKCSIEQAMDGKTAALGLEADRIKDHIRQYFSNVPDRKVYYLVASAV